MKKSQFLILLAILPFFSQAQEGRLKYANKLYNDMSYYYAAEAYEDVIERKIDSSVVANNIANSYDKIGNTEQAIKWFRFLERNNTITQEQQLRLALLEREVGNYGESENLMASYTKTYGELDVANEVIESNKYIDELKQLNQNFTVKEQTTVNTTSSEIGTNFYTENKVIVASSERRHMAVNTIFSWTGNYFYDLYYAPVDEEGQIGKLKKIKSKVQSKFHDGPAVYDSLTGYFYFTRNNFIDGKKETDENGVIRLKIFRAKLEKNKFKDVQELEINSNDYSNAHPSLSQDGKTMYFSSDRPGGIGGMDVYSIALNENGTVGTPVNMGSKVNTTQNDIFPYYNTSENLLFFSSNGHAGLGGLDIYVAKLNTSGQASKIENLGAPINSTKDDLSFVSNEEQTVGYFSSNRSGGKGDDDVYGFEQISPIKNSAVVNGFTRDVLTSLELEGATVYLKDKNGIILDSAVTDEQGKFEFSLDNIEDDFQLSGLKGGYTNDSKTVAFNAETKEYNQDLNLMPGVDYYFAGLITDRSTGSYLENVKVTMIDNATEEKANQSTNGTGEFKSDNLPYHFQDQINYGFKFEKEGYVTKVIEVTEVLAQSPEVRIEENMHNIAMDKNELGTNIGLDLEPIYFDLNSSVIRKDAAIELNKIVKTMKENPSISIELGSHTDSRASDEYNVWLSDRRAKSSASFIINQGISPDRITSKGYGETQLVESDEAINNAETEEQKEVLHQKNRRTEFIIVKK